MTRDEAKALIPLLQAYAEGKILQFNYGHPGGYKDYDMESNWYFHPADWRIKPKPKVIWVNEYAKGNVCFKSEQDANNFGGPTVVRKAVKYVEAL